MITEPSLDPFNKAKDILEKHGMNGTPNYYDGGNSINF